MKWININDEKPPEFVDVLVSDGIEPLDYTVAMYIGKKVHWTQEWKIADGMLDSEDDYGICSIFLDIPIKYWCEIEGPKEDINEMD